VNLKNVRRKEVRRKDPHTLAGAYAMDALDRLDQVRFERHLAGCDACAQEVAELRETAARLGAATAEPPPAALRERVLAAAAHTRQHVPVVEREKRRTFLIIVPATAAAGLIAVATVFGLANSDANQRLDQAQQRSQAISAVLTARDATMMTGQVTVGGDATIVMSHHMDALVFTVAGLPAAGRYQLWLDGPSGDRRAGSLTVSSDGTADPMIAIGLRPGDHLVLTAEPGGDTMLNIPL